MEIRLIIAKNIIFHINSTNLSQNNRFEDFEMEHPGESTSVCIVSALPQNTTSLMDVTGSECIADIATSVYVHTVYIGLACIPGSIILPLFIHKVGAKVFLSKSLISLVDNHFTKFRISHRK